MWLYFFKAHYATEKFNCFPQNLSCSGRLGHPSIGATPPSVVVSVSSPGGSVLYYLLLVERMLQMPLSMNDLSSYMSTERLSTIPNDGTVWRSPIRCMEKRTSKTAASLVAEFSGAALKGLTIACHFSKRNGLWTRFWPVPVSTKPATVRCVLKLTSTELKNRWVVSGKKEENACQTSGLQTFILLSFCCCDLSFSVDRLFLTKDSLMVPLHLHGTRGQQCSLYARR